MKLMAHTLEPIQKAEHQLKTLINLQIHLAAPFGINIKWFDLQNTSMSIPEDHCLLFDDIIFHLQKSKVFLTHQETVF